MSEYLRDDDKAPDGEHAALPDHVQEQLPHREGEVGAQQSGDRGGREGRGDIEKPPHDLYCGDGDEDGDGCDPRGSCDFFGYVCGGVVCPLLVKVCGLCYETWDLHPVRAHMGAVKESKNAQPPTSVVGSEFA